MSDPSMTVGLVEHIADAGKMVERLNAVGERLAVAYDARDRDVTTLVIDEEIVFDASAMTDEVREFLTKQADEIERLTRGVRHWQANHAEMVQRNAVLRERPDLPADRLPSIARYEARIAVLEALVARAAEELRLIRMKDSGAVYDVTIRIDLANALVTP